VFITEVESVYSAVRTDSLHKTDYVSFEKGLIQDHAEVQSGKKNRSCPVFSVNYKHEQLRQYLPYSRRHTLTDTHPGEKSSTNML
jgi:hypothetical protein